MMRPNPGHCPHEAYGKRVAVRLARAPAGTVSFTCSADGRGAPNWQLRGSLFDIAEYQVLG